jgi:hypothetical protein
MTDAEMRAVEQAAISPAQRLIVALAAIRTAPAPWTWVAEEGLSSRHLRLPPACRVVLGFPFGQGFG